MKELLLAIAATLVAGSQGLAAGDAVPSTPLAGTKWRLVEFQSMDDAQGIARPGEGTVYSMWLHGDGTVTMQLNCNRATGTWSAVPGSDAASGRFEFGPLAATRALCPPRASTTASSLRRATSAPTCSRTTGCI